MLRAARPLLVGLLLPLFLTPASAQPLPASQEVICPKVVFSPTLDGRLDDWPPLPQVVIAGATEWHPAAAEFATYGGPEDISTDVRCVWDNQALYLAVETRDDNLIRVQSAREIDRGDSIVLSFAGDGEAAANQFVVALLRGGSLVYRAQPAGRAGEVRTVDRALAARQEEGSWRLLYELAFPWSEMAPLRPIPGQGFALTVSACDDDGAGIEGCLEQTVRVLFAPDAGGILVGPARPASLPPAFLRPELARFEKRAFLLRNQPAFLFGGEVDYARLPAPTWPGRLALLKAVGMNVVSIAVPWSHHEPRQHSYDFRDLEAFLDLCQETELLVVLNLGPYAGDHWEAGGLPGWVLPRAATETLHEAAAAWYRALLPVVRPRQLTAGGPIAAVLARPVPDAAGSVTAASLQRLIELVGGGGIEVPMLTANAPPARDNSKQSLANMLDTLAFYGPASAADILPGLRALSDQENGPAMISALPGDYATPQAARRSAGAAKAALASGSTALLLSDFAPGLESTARLEPGGSASRAIIDLAGAHTPGYGELRLLGHLVRTFSGDLTRAVAAEGVVKADDPEVRAAARLAEKTGFIFLWDEKGAASHQVRLTYTPPGTTATISIPEAGAISLPAGSAKVLVLDAPVGRGLLHYSTSEVAGTHQVGDRTLLVVYGDLDTPGEIALRWPGPPLVLGEVTRQRWDPEKNTLILDYYHTQKDQYLLVDELEIAILSRERAASAAQIAGEAGAVTISAGAEVAGAWISSDALDIALDCPAGELQLTAALPRPPVTVSLEGKPVEFSFATPARVLTLSLTTEPFEEERRPTVLNRLSRALLGGPPKLSAAFDRAWFLSDTAAPRGTSRPVGAIARAPEELGLATGSFVRLRASFEALGPARLRITGSTHPALVFVNGRLVPELSGTASEREAEISGRPSGGNEIEILLDLRPRADGFPGIWQTERLPEVTVLTSSGPATTGDWELCVGLAGEAAGWTQFDLEASRWHFLRFGPWRRQGREPAKVAGVGWYRLPFGLPRPDGWQIPYYLGLNLHGSGAVYLNGARLATCDGPGSYLLPLPSPPLSQGEENILAAAIYGLTPQVGLDRVEISADRSHMTRRRTLTIRF